MFANVMPETVLWIIQTFAFVCAIWYYKHYKQTKQRLFVWFLAFVMLTEFVGVVFILYFGIDNYSVYNVFTIVSGYFYLFWFKSILKQKLLLIGLIIVFSASICISIISEDFFGGLWNIALITLSVIILISVMLFYSNLLNSNALVKFQYDQQFWICTGLLIFYLGFLPLLLFPSNYFKEILSGYNIALIIINGFMYGFFAVGFICLTKKD